MNLRKQTLNTVVELLGLLLLEIILAFRSPNPAHATAHLGDQGAGLT